MENSDQSKDWVLWEVFIRSKDGLDHRHCGSLMAPDSDIALIQARDVYTRRKEGVSIWVIPSSSITASDPADKDSFFTRDNLKDYRHPSFYPMPDDVKHI